TTRAYNPGDYERRGVGTRGPARERVHAGAAAGDVRVCDGPSFWPGDGGRPPRLLHRGEDRGGDGAAARGPPHRVLHRLLEGRRLHLLDDRIRRFLADGRESGDAGAVRI